MEDKREEGEGARKDKRGEKRDKMIQRRVNRLEDGQGKCIRKGREEGERRKREEEVWKRERKSKGKRNVSLRERDT